MPGGRHARLGLSTAFVVGYSSPVHSRPPASAPGRAPRPRRLRDRDPRPAEPDGAGVERRGPRGRRTRARPRPGRRHGKRARSHRPRGEHDGAPERGRAACERRGGARAGRARRPALAHWSVHGDRARGERGLRARRRARTRISPIPCRFQCAGSTTSTARRSCARSPARARPCRRSSRVWRRRWAPLRPSVVGHGGGTVAAAYGRHVTAMQHLAAGPAAHSGTRRSTA